jgi:hypothetical protein
MLLTVTVFELGPMYVSTIPLIFTLSLSLPLLPTSVSCKKSPSLYPLSRKKPERKKRKTSKADTDSRKTKQPKEAKPAKVENAEWKAMFGEKAAQAIRDTVDANVEDYEYLKSFALRV